MFNYVRTETIEPAEFEHRIPFAWALVGIVVVGNLGFVAVMLAAQG